MAGKFVDGFTSGGDITDSKWLSDVHSPSLLKELFDELSGVNLSYEKPAHSVALTEWLLANRPEALFELRDYIEELSSKVSQTNAGFGPEWDCKVIPKSEPICIRKH
jgi:hypothetical protein